MFRKQELQHDCLLKFRLRFFSDLSCGCTGGLHCGAYYSGLQPWVSGQICHGLNHMSHLCSFNSSPAKLPQAVCVTLKPLTAYKPPETLHSDAATSA